MLVLLAVGGIVAVVLSGQIPDRWRSLAYQEICDGRASYFYQTDLFDVERKSSSSVAKVYKVLSFNNQSFRVVSDQTDEFYTLSFFNDSRQTYTFPQFKIELMGISDIKNDVTLKPSNSLTFNIKKSDIHTEASPNISSLKIFNGNDCIASIPNLLETGQKAQMGDQVKNINANESGSIRVPPGIVPIGFSDWRKFDLFTANGLSILSYNSEDEKGWLTNPQKSRFIAEPGVGYLLYNSGSKNVDIPLDGYFKVPDDIGTHSIRIGWNLLYNDTGHDATLGDIKVRISEKSKKRQGFETDARSLQSLIDDKLGSDSVYRVSKLPLEGTKGEFEKISDLIPGSAVFWFYLFEEPSGIDLVKPNIVFNLEEEGDKLKRGDTIHLKFKIKNEDTISHFVDSEKEKDPCQIGIEAKDSKNNIIYSELNKKYQICPLWPLQTELKPGDTITYSREFKIPSNLSGELKIKGYFNYTRLDSFDMLLDEITLKVSNG